MAVSCVIPETTVVATELEGGVLHVTLNRPERINAFTGVTEQEISTLWRWAGVEPEVRAIVLDGAGERGFCSGLDVRSDDQVQAMRVRNRWAREDTGTFLGPKSNRCFKPMIAAVHGICCGGALYFLAESDFIVAADDAEFFDPHTSVGLAPIFETALFRRRMPYGDLMRLMLMGSDERIGAQRALDIGLVTEVVAPDQLQRRALELAGKIAAKPTAAVQGAVFAGWQSLISPLRTILDVGLALTDMGNVDADMMAGARDGAPKYESR
jgi:enoyl-CoA hydratase/carnithine racemase